VRGCMHIHGEGGGGDLLSYLSKVSGGTLGCGEKRPVSGGVGKGS